MKNKVEPGDIRNKEQFLDCYNKHKDELAADGVKVVRAISVGWNDSPQMSQYSLDVDLTAKATNEEDQYSAWEREQFNERKWNWFAKAVGFWLSAYVLDYNYNDEGGRGEITLDLETFDIHYASYGFGYSTRHVDTNISKVRGYFEDYPSIE